MTRARRRFWRTSHREPLVLPSPCGDRGGPAVALGPARGGSPMNATMLRSVPINPLPTDLPTSPAWFDESLTAMVRREARRIYRRLPPSSTVTVEELYSIGLLALVEAERRY